MTKLIKIIAILFIIAIIFTLMICFNKKNTLLKEKEFFNNGENTSEMDKEAERKVLIRVGEQEFTAVFYNNDSAKSVFDMLPFTLDMADMNQNEKFYYFNKSLPINFNRIERIDEGDIMLYGSDCLVLFYESFSTRYTYTPLGYIENTDKLKESLGKGNITVTFSAK